MGDEVNPLDCKQWLTPPHDLTRKGYHEMADHGYGGGPPLLGFRSIGGPRALRLPQIVRSCGSSCFTGAMPGFPGLTSPPQASLPARPAVGPGGQIPFYLMRVDAARKIACKQWVTK